jgi:hypothetical protein
VCILSTLKNITIKYDFCISCALLFVQLVFKLSDIVPFMKFTVALLKREEREGEIIVLLACEVIKLHAH